LPCRGHRRYSLGLASDKSEVRSPFTKDGSQGGIYLQGKVEQNGKLFTHKQTLNNIVWNMKVGRFFNDLKIHGHMSAFFMYILN
jgi:hypothetical protein